MIKKLAGIFISSAMTFALSSSTQAQTTPSVWVYYDSSHHLQYQPDALGNHILDFSFAGYEGGGVALPNLPVRVTVTPTGGDDTANIQNAINQVSQLTPDFFGFRGAILLAPGNLHAARNILLLHCRL
jgi:hypothetical protein